MVRTVPETLEIKRNDLERIIEEMKSSRAEICGFIIGKIEGRKAIAAEVRSARNLLNSSVRFQIDPQEFLKVLREAEIRKMDVIGFYHSHPSLPEPSPEDEKFMRLWPDKIWLIVSSISTLAKAFIKAGKEIKEIKIEGR